MYKIPIAEIKEKILSSGKLNPEELDNRIKDKINELSGLISEEGAAHIIAHELGLELVKLEQSKLKIKEIYAGMRGLTTVGKVIRKFEPKEFVKGDSIGKVCSLIIGDETGTVRLVFWNEQVDLLGSVNEEDIILVKNTYARENNGNREIHFNEHSELVINPPGEEVEKVRQSSVYERKSIDKLGPGEEGVEIFGTVVQVFDPRFFKVCPQCAKRVTESGDIFNCAEHGAVEPALSYVLNLILDDGTGIIRGVFWKNQTNHLLGKNEEELARYQENLALFEEVKNDLLGEQFKLMGKTKQNEMFDRLEFNVQLVEKANPLEEIKRMKTD